MNKYYLTADKVGDFIARMWQAGVNVDIEPRNHQITIKKDGKYEWIHVFEKGSYDDLCNAFITSTDAPNTEA